METRKQVHTTISKEMARLAAIHEIKWAEAIETGITILSGIKTEEKDIIEQINQKELEIDYLKKRLEEIRKKQQDEEAKKKKEENSRVYMVVD